MLYPFNKANIGRDRDIMKQNKENGCYTRNKREYWKNLRETEKKKMDVLHEKKKILE